MGINNKQRRAAKAGQRRKRAREAAARVPRHGWLCAEHAEMLRLPTPGEASPLEPDADLR